MSYTEEDARWEELWDQMSQELYPQHKEQAIEEFTTDRLQSLYLKEPNILSPGIRMFVEARKLLEHSPSASYVFAASAIELFLKASLLKPVVYGLVHNEALSDIIAKTAFGSTGFERYKKLLGKLFSELLGIDIEGIKRHGADNSLLHEASAVQKCRNGIIHQGASAETSDAELAISVAYSILHGIINPMLLGIGLWADKTGRIMKRGEGRKEREDFLL